jgi:hypothetical protein
MPRASDVEGGGAGRFGDSHTVSILVSPFLAVVDTGLIAVIDATADAVHSTRSVQQSLTFTQAVPHANATANPHTYAATTTSANPCANAHP